MANDSNLSEDAIRLRSYLIWQRGGCPQGSALDHWLCAKAELEAELQATATIRIAPARRPAPSQSTGRVRHAARFDFVTATQECRNQDCTGRTGYWK